MLPASVLPAFYSPGVARVRETVVGDARIWVNEARSTAPLVLLPDLSHDVVVTSAGPHLTARTTSTGAVPLERGNVVCGVRLPIAAVDVRLDAGWPGWTRGRRHAEELLWDALEAKAIRWRQDPLVQRVLRELRPETRLLQLSSALRMPERTLRRQVGAKLGVTPIHVARVMRLWRLLSLIRGTTIADAAAEAGFSDQSHASREARALSGMTVRELGRMNLAE